MIWKSCVVALVPLFLGGCMYASIPNYASYYYDDWFGEFQSEIRYVGNDRVYQFSIGYEDPASGMRSKFILPEDQVPIFPDFIEVQIGNVSFMLNELTPEIASKFAFSGPNKSGFIEYGDAVSFSAKGMNITFYDKRPVYIYCSGENITFRNINNGKSGVLPMSVRKMKAIFGEPSRKKKDVVL